MRPGLLTILILWMIIGVITSSVSGQEFNVKELLKMQEPEDPKSSSGIFEELKKLICVLDSLLAEVSVSEARSWERDLFKPLVLIKAGTGTGLQVIDESAHDLLPPILTGTALSGDLAIAIFGQIEVGVGDVIDGFRIISIGIGQVVIESRNGQREILIVNGEK